MKNAPHSRHMIRSALLTTFAISGCAQTAEQASAEKPASDVKAPKQVQYREHSDAQLARPASGTAQPADLRFKIAEDLAQRLHVDATDLQVVAIEPVVWDDGALGCPQPGKSYIAAQTPGFLILFQYDAKTYQYHASDRGAFVYCPNPTQHPRSLDRQ